MAYELSIGDFAFGVAGFFIAGIFVTSLSWDLFIAAIVIFAALVGIRYITRIFFWRHIAIMLAAFLCGAFYCRSYLNRDAETLILPFNKEISFPATVVDEPKESGNYEIFTAEPWHSHDVIVLAPLGSGFRYGDLLQVRGMLEKPDAPGDDPLAIGVHAAIIAHHRGFWLREQLISVKDAILEKYRQFLPQDQAALLGGITLGGSTGLSTELKNQMESSGTSYILSMYGYKIAAMTAMAAAALENFFSRRLVLYVCLTLIALTLLMAGLMPAAVRAGIMAAIAIAAKEIERPLDKRNAIVFTALIMLVADPLLLTGDAGFQLSFLSVIGMTYLQEPIKRWWRYDDPGFLEWRAGSAATLAVLAPMVPLVSNADGQFPITAIASNILIFMTTPISMFFGAVLAAVSFLFPLAAFFIAKIGSGIVQYQLFIIKLFSIVVVPLPLSFHIPIITVLYYAALVMFACYFYEDE